ncbi:hypothetical protein, partial [Pseudomonas sp. NPDC089401]|uniref:hypothetical protein n=1 Tax=Pseudomonas sp. NPDC089401 TaxID=3364462 RepID=UPI0037F2C8A1
VCMAPASPVFAGEPAPTQLAAGLCPSAMLRFVVVFSTAMAPITTGRRLAQSLWERVYREEPTAVHGTGFAGVRG